MKNKILIVEDNSMLSMIYTQLLKGAGYLVETAINGHQALSLLSQDKPDLILLELNLSEVSGASVLEFVKNESVFADTKVVLHSSDDRLAAQFLDQADSYVRKPSSIHDLLASVNDLLVPVA